MEGKRSTARAQRIVPLVAALTLVALLASACKGATVSSGSSDLKLSFRVLGGASASLSSKSISGLILPSASKLTVSLAPVDSGLATPDSQTVAISSTGASTVSVTFSDLELGKYTVKAVAADSSGAAQFQQTSTLTVSGTSSSATLNLVPVNAGYTLQNTNGSYENVTYYSPIALNAGAAYTIEVPAAALSDGIDNVIAYSQYELSSYTSGSSCLFFIQDSDGSLLMKGSISTDGITPDGGSMGSVYLTPSQSFSTSKPSYITLYNNSGTTIESMTVIINSDNG